MRSSTLVLIAVMALGLGGCVDGTAHQQECEAGISSYWSLAKAGDLNARDELATLAAYSRYSLLSGEADKIICAEDFRTLAIHSFGSKHSMEYAEKNLDVSSNVKDEELTEMKNFMYFNDSDLQNCVEKTPSPACTQIAIERGYVPTFESFAAEIDQETPDWTYQYCARQEEQRVRQNAHQQATIDKSADGNR